VNEYFSYLWKSDTGVVESEVLDEIPGGLKADIRLARYGTHLKKSIMFTKWGESSHTLDVQLTRSVLRMVRIQYYTTGDTIIFQDDFNTSVYVILEGSASVLLDDRYV
jgi:hypothetical protein